MIEKAAPDGNIYCGWLEHRIFFDMSMHREDQYRKGCLLILALYCVWHALIHHNVPFLSKRKLQIAWIIPPPIKGSGGLRTMIQNANHLALLGHHCDLYVDGCGSVSEAKLRETIKDMYGDCLCIVHAGVHELTNHYYDTVFGTYSVNTAGYAAEANAKKKAYFIQDFEPWFQPMGSSYLQMERTYRLGLEGISIGRWLAHKLTVNYAASMHYFNFCADLQSYTRLDHIQREYSVCFLLQPEKPRRCADLGIKALQLVKKARPHVRLYAYGSDARISLPPEINNCKLLTVAECNLLYNRCSVGLCLSSSNPSRIPFEMMATGLPVVDLYRENNLYDIPEAGALLAEATPEAIATALISILDNKTMRADLSQNGYTFMRDYPLSRGFTQLAQFVHDLNRDNLKPLGNIHPIYKRAPVTPDFSLLTSGIKG